MQETLALFYGDNKASGAIYSLYEAMQEQYAQYYDTIVGDALMLPLVGLLAGESGPWDWPAGTETKAAQASQNVNQLGFWQILTSGMYNVLQWPPGSIFPKVGWWNEGYNMTQCNHYTLTVPAWAYFGDASGYYMMFAGEFSSISGRYVTKVYNPDFPPESMLNAMLANPEIGLNSSDFWLS